MTKPEAKNRIEKLKKEIDFHRYNYHVLDKETMPAAALTAAEGGLADLRAILAGAPRFLTAGGWLALETGITQHAELARLAAAAGFKRTESLPDLTGRDRFLFAWRE